MAIGHLKWPTRSKSRPPGCRKITGVAGLWRIRSGKYRIVYQVREKELVVLVVKVGHRKDVYL